MVPSIITVHDLFHEDGNIPFNPLKRWWYKVAVSRAIKTSDHIITPSGQTKSDICAYFPSIAADRISVIPEGSKYAGFPVAHNKIEEVKRKYHLTRPYLFTLGSAEPRKNIGTLLDAFRLIQSEYPRYDLVVGGETTRTTDASGKVHEKIHVLGYVPESDLPYLYAGADVFVFPSCKEGFGLPVLEAMSLSLPVVVADDRALHEVAGTAALYFQPHDAGNLAACLRQVLTHAGLKEKLQQNGYQRSLTFSWQKAACETVELYQQVGNHGKN